MLLCFCLKSFSENLKVLSAWLAFTLRGEVPSGSFWGLVYAPLIVSCFDIGGVSCLQKSRKCTPASTCRNRHGVVLIVLLSLISFNGWKH